MLNPRPMGKDELADFLSSGEPDAFESFKANLSEGFDNSIPGVSWNETKEQAAGLSVGEITEGFIKGKAPEPETPKTLTFDEYKKSPDYREGVEFKDGWTKARAEILAKGFDERKQREFVMSQSPDTLSRKAVGFVGQLAGGVVDPINLIPFGRGVKLGGKVASKIAAGVVEGAVGNLAVSAITRPYYEARGVDSDWQDYVSDVFIGGVMGGSFSAAGHVISVPFRKTEINLPDQAKLGEAADYAIDAVATGKEVDLTKVPELEKTYQSIYEIPEVQRSRRVQDLSDQLVEIGYSADDARTSIAPMVAQAEAFSRDMNISIDDFLDKYGATFQKSEIRNGKILGTDPDSKRAQELIDGEIKNMLFAVKDAEPGTRSGKQIVNPADGEGYLKNINTSTESTFPEWYRELGVKNKDHLAKVVESRKGPIYDRIVAMAEDRLLNGADDGQGGFSAPLDEFRTLKGMESAEIPLGQDGAPLFQKKELRKSSGGKERGAITFKDDGPAIIHLFENADQSTIIHETGHLFLNNLERFSALKEASPALKQDLESIRSWMGVEPGAKIETKHHEKFARGFEQYLREGKAPRPELQSVFSRFKDWLTSIYKSNTQLKAKLSDDARQVYSRLLGPERRPKVTGPTEPIAPAALFKDEAEIDARTSEISSMTAAREGLATPDEMGAFDGSIAEIDAETRALDELATFFQGAKTDEAMLEAANKAGISKSQFEILVDDFNKKLMDEENARLGIEKVIEQRRMELAAEAKELKRQAYLSLGARTEVLNHVDTIKKAGGSYKQAVLSILEGDSSLRGVQGAGKSVDGHYMALAQSTSVKAFSELRKIDSNIERLFEDDIQFNQTVIKEIVTPGSTGDGVASKAAATLTKYSEELRQRANLAGAKIGKLDGHIPRAHDIEKLVGKMDDWTNFMMENLDPERVFKGMSDAEKREALLEVYSSLVTDNHATKEIDVTEPLRRVPRNIAKKMGESRSLHFKSAEAELNYLKQFGQGENILETMASHYERMSRSISLMERLGPNPENTLAHTLQKITDDIKADVKSGKMSSADADKALKEMGSVNKLKSRDSDIGQALSMALGEMDSTEGFFKSGARFLRGWNSLSKLGSALLSQPTDFVHALNERRILSPKNEASHWAELFKDYFTNPTKEQKDVLEHVGIYVDAMNMKNFNRFEGDNINGKLARANDLMFKWSGQNWHVRHAKQAAALSLSRELGANIAKSWDKVSPGLKETMSQYGSIDETKWKILQTAKAQNLDGKDFYHPGLIQEISDDVLEPLLPQEFQAGSKSELLIDGEQSGEMKSWEERRKSELKRARFKLEMDLKTFFVEESRNAAPEPDAKVRRMMSFGSKSGTKANEAIKLVSQFKTFAFVNYDRSIKGRRMMRNDKDFGGLAHHAVATLALGYLSTVLKDLAKGLEPADPAEFKTWGRAAFQSGGLGVMGDFLQAGVSSRSGADALTSLLGPTLSTVGSGINLAGKTLREPFKPEREQDTEGLVSDWFDFARANAPAPFSSLWYTRSAMDHLVWQNLKETLEPGSIRRSEKRLKKEYNQKYLISPRETQWLKNATR